VHIALASKNFIEQKEFVASILNITFC